MMTASTAQTNQVANDWDRSNLPASGRTRYAAAMYFFGRGMIGHEALEVYRICSPLDREDPHMLLATGGLASEVAVASAPNPTPT